MADLRSAFKKLLWYVVSGRDTPPPAIEFVSPLSDETCVRKLWEDVGPLWKNGSHLPVREAIRSSEQMQDIELRVKKRFPYTNPLAARLLASLHMQSGRTHISFRFGLPRWNSGIIWCIFYPLIFAVMNAFRTPVSSPCRIVAPAWERIGIPFVFPAIFLSLMLLFIYFGRRQAQVDLACLISKVRGSLEAKPATENIGPI